MLPPDGRVRVVVERVSLEIECSTLLAKRVIGDFWMVELDISTDIHL